MKKTILALVVVVAANVPAFAQGLVAFLNIGASKPVQWDENNDGLGDRDLTSGDGVQLSLWYAPAGTTDRNDPVWQMLGIPASVFAPGLFSGGNRRVPDATEGTVYAFQVRAWETAIYGTAPTAWAQASTTLGAKVTVFTPILETVTAIDFPPYPPPVNLSPLFAREPNIVVGRVVPEPSVFALAALGAGALLLLRRWWG